MSVMLAFLAVVAGFGGWWLSRQRLTAKPWLEEGLLGEFPGTGAVSVSPAKLGLGAFLVVAGCLFALLISAYFVRMELPAQHLADTVRLPTPRLLWLNTFLLLLGSAALHWARTEIRNGELRAARADLAAGAAASIAFVIGQLLVWLQLVRAGYYVTYNPAYSFFYLLTGAHALHVAGGLIALGVATARAWRTHTKRLRQAIELCTTYWHFLLLVWVVVLVVVMGWANDFVQVCRAFIG